jgi:hypothetical protein
MANKEDSSAKTIQALPGEVVIDDVQAHAGDHVSSSRELSDQVLEQGIRNTLALIGPEQHGRRTAPPDVAAPFAAATPLPCRFSTVRAESAAPGLLRPGAARSQASFLDRLSGQLLVMVKFSTPHAEVVPVLLASPL